MDYLTYSLGDFKLKNGGSIPDAKIGQISNVYDQEFLIADISYRSAYKTFGDSSKPLIIYPTWYSGLIANNEWLIGTDKTLNPEKYFIVITALFGNGESSSPSNRPEIRPWPEVLFYDNVSAQYELVTKELKKDHARAVLGEWLMSSLKDTKEVSTVRN